MKPLVSILIPAFNVDRWLADTIESALAQTYGVKEVIVVDDGSSDRTLSVARRYASRNVKVVSKKNEGAAATRNHALSLSQGDYIQWLDGDDILAPDKIERQLNAVGEGNSTRILLSGPWAHFRARIKKANFVPNSLWENLDPDEWLLRKMRDNLHMQTATWMTSRELTDAAGSWDTRLTSDDDGEYFCRVLAASDGVKFVPESRVYYRLSPSSRLSFIGRSGKKMESQMMSIRAHIRCLRRFDDSARAREACLSFLRMWGPTFHPERPDLLKELQDLGEDLGGKIEMPRLRWKYRWMCPLFGYQFAKTAQQTLPEIRGRWLFMWDSLLSRFEGKEEKLR